MNQIDEKQNAGGALPPKGRTGYVALLGRPNTGKSTFLNTVLGCHLAAVSSKPQTTRRSMLGIYNDDESQIIFLDAPGVHPSKIAIDEAMEESVSKVLEDADVVVCLIDPTRVPGEEDGLAAGLAGMNSSGSIDFRRAINLPADAPSNALISNDSESGRRSR